MVSYIIDLCMIIVLAVPLYLLIRKPWRRSRRREMLLMGFWLFNAALLMLALDGSCPAPSDILSSALNRIVTRDGINLVPFRTILSYFGSPSAEQFLINIVGNTVMFMPWGFGLSLLWERNRNPFRIAGLSLAFTAAIELCQLFVGRAVDVDDIILNFTGSMLGAAAWYILDRIWRKKTAKQPQPEPAEPTEPTEPTEPPECAENAALAPDAEAAQEENAREEEARAGSQPGQKALCAAFVLSLLLAAALLMGNCAACPACADDEERTYYDGGATYYSLDKPIDRLLVLPFSYDTPDETYCRVIESERQIALWKGSHRWSDFDAICCDEYTTHEIVAFDGCEKCCAKSYSSYYGGYNNLAFSLVQGMYVADMETALRRQWQYRAYSDESTDFAALQRQMQEAEGWLAYDSYSDGERLAFALVVPSKLGKQQRAAAAEGYGIAFAVDEAEENE